MEFQDRVSAYPNRYLLTDENGNTSYVHFERADEPTVVGTPLNAETFNKMMIESDEYPNCYYRMVDGEQEWLNPPMTETWKPYRTTKRFKGNVVYAIRCVCALPNNTSKFTGLENLGIKTIVDYHAATGTEAVPAKWQDHMESGGLVTKEIAITVATWGISLFTNFDASASTCDVTVEYCVV